MKDVINYAHQLGLFCTTYSPGDGATRYRFSEKDEDYFACRGITTVLGARDARLWLSGYSARMEVERTTRV